MQERNEKWRMWLMFWRRSSVQEQILGQRKKWVEIYFAMLKNGISRRRISFFTHRWKRYLDCRLGWWALRKSAERSVKNQSVWSWSETEASFWFLAQWSRFLAKQTQRTHFFCLLFLVTKKVKALAARAKCKKANRHFLFDRILTPPDISAVPKFCEAY